jgi:hypothetical protein
MATSQSKGSSRTKSRLGGSINKKHNIAKGKSKKKLANKLTIVLC